jgi:peptide chain release factor 1
MAIAWHELQERHASLSEQLASSTIDQFKRAALQKEHARLGLLLEKHAVIKSLENVIAQTRQQMEQADDAELRELFADEISVLEGQCATHTKELDQLLYPADPMDDRSVFLEIRAGTGGQEAALFAADLLKMYTNYSLRRNWEVSVVDMSETDLGGIREVILHIQGKRVYAHLKHEAGVHRVQRVPQTETSGRVHTSTATVAVLPEAQEVEFSINPADLRIDTYRAGGAGGQHVNKTESAVRVTHIPSGVAVACQEERSQHKNKAKAMKMLQSRLFAFQEEKTASEAGQKRKEMVGTGERAEKVRTYNFPQNRITDHQVDVTLKKLDRVIEGDLDEIIDALMAKDKVERRKKAAQL